MPPEPSAGGEVLRAVVFFGVARDGLIDFAALRPADADAVEALLEDDGASVVVRSAAFLATIILGRAGRLAFVLVVLTLMALEPSLDGFGRSAIGGRLFGHSQHRSMLDGRT